ncbi:fumarylacetoacetate hydrolase family protein [Paenibacillus thalictri]|uniref:FAA hydrolase family protein n=1 Tax=Paenibacillus thalictri TaxID=2527873 RepID=A0A4Q9DES3_9BACL|nr:fumarylacetoacetate hydrolase family protein [Paenibacillus thalictri]TBL70300.1 FAA hydrolase family protein [Paenibacillus thalictri]
MRLVSFAAEGQTRVGLKTDAGVFDTGYLNMIDLIQAGEAGLQAVRKAEPLNKVVTNYELLAPLTAPGKILCSGINYSSHKQENPNAVFPKKPSFFSKLPSSIIGPNQAIVLPEPESQVDYEVELALVIGRTAKHVAREHALDYVFGYTICNDVSGRDLQFQLQHETIGKGIDSFCPLGPEIVLTDEIPNPAELHVSSYVNGELRQSSSTSDMLFDIPELIRFVTQYLTLYPGDVITTGTPAGCGTFRVPPVFLKAGDVVEVCVDRIGRLVNPVVSGW